MLTFANPGCTWVPDGPGSACWRADGAAALCSCAAGPAMSWACIDEPARFTILMAHSLFGLCPDCMGAGTDGAASPSLALLLGGGDGHSS